MTNYCVYMTCRLYVQSDDRELVYNQVDITPTEDFVEWEIDRIEECD